jgi:hypothetical protein
MLSSIYKYKKSAGLFLLALYFFIAAPVSLWHHHKTVSSRHESINSIYNTCLTDAEDINNEPCNICTHHYADCLQTFAHFVDFIPSLTGIIHPVSDVSVIKVPIYSLSNKGPPSGLAI